MAEKKITPDLNSGGYKNLSIIFGIVGIAVAYINTRYLVAGLTKMEADPDMLSIAVLSGIVIIVCDLLFFSTAAFLSWRHVTVWKLKLILIGLVVLAAEIVGMYTAMKGIDTQKVFASSAALERAKTLQASIDAKVNATEKLAENAESLKGTKHTWAKVAAGSQLEKALKDDPSIKTDAAEIAAIKAGRQPTMTDLYGEEWAPWIIFGKSVFFAILGLVTVGASGYFLRRAREVSPAPITTPAVDEVMENETGNQRGKTMRRGWARRLAAALGLSSAAALSPTHASATEPVQTTQSPRSSDAATPSDDERANAPKSGRSKEVEATTGERSVGSQNAAISGRSEQPGGSSTNATISGRSEEVGANASTEASATKKKRVSRKEILSTGGKVDSGITPGSDSRYQRVKSLILSRQIKPSIRAVQAKEGGSDPVVSRYLAQMEIEGLLVKTPSGRYTLAPKA